MKLWEKGYSPDKTIESFTVGKDPVLDLELLPYDLDESKAHVHVLENAGVLTSREVEVIIKELEVIRELWKEGEFKIDVADEDCHTAIENHLTRKLGDVGKKIHTARSRNDQVLTATRLLQKDRLGQIRDTAKDLHAYFQEFSELHSEVPMPGFTHTRKAMPYTVGKWIGSFADSLQDDLYLMDTVLKLVDQNPLGTGAGFGISFPLDREISTRELGFQKTMSSSLYAQNSRGKIESSVLFVCTSVLTTLNRWASDIILFTMPEFQFFTLDDALTTGSSIMPHKKNPDVLELIRSSVHQVIGYQYQVQSTTLNLLSGYHRDIQLTKEPLFSGLKTTLDSLTVSNIVIRGLTVNQDNLTRAMSDDLFSVDKVYQLVKRGVPFREAYKIVAESLL